MGDSIPEKHIFTDRDLVVHGDLGTNAFPAHAIELRLTLVDQEQNFLVSRRRERFQPAKNAWIVGRQRSQAIGDRRFSLAVFTEDQRDLREKRRLL